MATYEYKALKEQYVNFSNPQLSVFINEKDFEENNDNLKIADVEIEITAGYEASVATFWIYNGFSQMTSSFLYDSLKAYITIGFPVTIATGYDGVALEIFKGFITQVNFIYEEGGMPGVKVTCMDIKGVMMASNYARQLKAMNYSDAVKEIFDSEMYAQMKSNGLVTDFQIADTPDKKESGGGAGGGGGEQKATDQSIEMVGESDYEFVVKAAKKFNFEFFTISGNVLFRPAKANTDPLIELGPSTGLKHFDVEYDITGLVGNIEVRSLDVGKAKQISATTKLSNKISYGGKATGLLKNSKKVYIDPTAAAQADCQNRLNYLVEDISYRFGTLTAELIGLPELLPGRFIILKGLGKGPDNTFYLQKVIHTMDTDNGYQTKIIAKAAKLPDK